MLARNNGGLLSLLLCIAMGASPLAAYAASVPAVLPDPDGKPAPAKKVQVFILSGQSNMCGMGSPDSIKGLANEKEFGYLVDDSGGWTKRNDAYYVFYSQGKANRTSEGWVSAVVNGHRVGPEGAIGHILGHHLDEPVLLIKVACGNRSLAHDVCPPTSRKRLGKDGQTGRYCCGFCYDRWFNRAKEVLKDMGSHYPGYKGQGFEIGGFFWWQGHKDRGSSKQNYEALLVDLINDLRKDFNAPKAPFVVATVGFSGMSLGAWKGVWEAQMAVGDPSQHPEYRGNVASVDIRDIGGGGFHYGNNGARYTRIGDRMGRAMVKLLDYAAAKEAKPKPKPKPSKRVVSTVPAQPPGDIGKERAAGRLLQTARSAERMGQRGLAMTFYKKIVKEYPDTEAAKKARAKLK